MPSILWGRLLVQIFSPSRFLPHNSLFGLLWPTLFNTTPSHLLIFSLKQLSKSSPKTSPGSQWRRRNRTLEHRQSGFQWKTGPNTCYPFGSYHLQSLCNRCLSVYPRSALMHHLQLCDTLCTLPPAQEISFNDPEYYPLVEERYPLLKFGHVKWVDLVCRSTLATNISPQTTLTIFVIAWAQRAAGTAMVEAAAAMAAASPRRERHWPPPSVSWPVGASLRGLPRGGTSLPPAAAAMATHSNEDILFQYMCNKAAAREAAPISFGA